MFKINQNFHIHSTLSGCASKNMFIKAIIAEAEKCSMFTIAITDHIDNPKTKDHRGRQLIGEYRKIRDLKFFSSNLRILLGCEITQTNPNTFSIADEIADEMDIILVSCNHYHLKYVDKPLNIIPYVDKPPDISPVNYADHYLTMVEGALNWKYTNVIAHPFHLHKLKWIDHARVLKNYDVDRLKNILRIAADKGVAFELCPRHFKNHLDFFAQLLLYGREYGTKFSIGTDAHKLSQVCYGEEDLKILAAIGVKEEDLWRGAKF